ncbi:ABC transporter ATP-binding protein [Arachnia rubra]|uniref:ABC transporter ATP-binding protein n=1 Tax=Arachnia rubra TaxID=1547448 RepID=A0ABX7Y5Y0_9ACTN|nr:ABC transporter ATP-binding protein [Arachnia rubra]QUC08492.1 ABC transporter ATP-binding protein [Arachnia rubra]BCR79884.1 protein-tyrosine-phosphatase [Arachnia rubra]
MHRLRTYVSSIRSIAAKPERGKPSMRRSLRLVAPDVTPHRALILAGVVALLMEVAFRVLEPWPMKVVVDAVTAYRGAKVSHQPASFELLLWCGIALLLIVGLRAVSNYLATICFALVGSRAATSLRARVFRHVQGLSQQFHARNRSADTVQRIVGDVARMQEVAITAGLPLLANVLTLFVMVIVMYVLDALLASVVLVAILVFAFTSAPTSKKITSASRQTRKGEGQLANTAQESLASINVVQAYGLEDMVAQNFTSANRTSLREGVRSRRYAARLERTTDVIVGLATAVVLVGGGLRVMQGAMSPGDLVLFTTYLRTTMKPLRDMAKYTGRIARASASGDRVADLMEIAPDVVAPETPLRPTAVWGAVQFDRVVTQYDGVEVLRGLSLDIRPGERVAIIGPSGAGKSTLVSLLVRAIDPVSGCVRLDGYRLTDLDLAQLRSSVSLLHQEAVLFTGTIRENIRMGRSDATDAEVEAAARAANAHDFITEQPEGYDTVVGERGGTLSGGQRQRIAIARALLRRSPVVVLDEATTGLDPEAASLVLDAIDRLSAGRTTLAVTHDAEVALRATRVVWVEDGRIRLDASPTDLLANSEVFRAWIQASGRDMDAIRIGSPQ